MNKIQKKYLQLVDKVANYYVTKGFSDSEEWYVTAKTKEEFSKGYLEFARDTNYIKLKKIVKVVEALNFYGKANNLEPTDISIFDAGCGPGVYDCILGNLGYNVVGVDFNKEMIERARQRAKSLSVNNVEFICTDALLYLEERGEKYHVIMALDSLEHMENPEGLIKVSHTILWSPGMLIIIIPNGWSLVELLYHPFADFLNQKCLKREFSKGATHIQRFSLKRLRGYLNNAGFYNIKVSATYSSLFSPLFFSGFRGKLALLNLKIADILPRFLAGGWVIYCDV